jgi:hypothetical protein
MSIKYIKDKMPHEGIKCLTEKMPKKFMCEKCSFSTDKNSNLQKHFETKKHKSKNVPKIKMSKFSCLLCDYYCDSIKDYNKHCKTKKHINNIENDIKIENEDDKEDMNVLILKILDENKEMRQLLTQQQEQLRIQQEVHHKEIMELIPRIGNKFNLNVFLNEKCKDAVNWDDFMNDLKIDTSNTEKSSITDCVLKTLCNNIQELGIYKRPIHCTDIKRKKIYIKHKNNWENDVMIVKEKLKQATNKIQRKYNILLDTWEKQHPNWYENEDETIIFSKLINKFMADVDEHKCMTIITKNVSIPKLE